MITMQLLWLPWVSRHIQPCSRLSRILTHMFKAEIMRNYCVKFTATSWTKESISPCNHKKEITEKNIETNILKIWLILSKGQEAILLHNDKNPSKDQWWMRTCSILWMIPSALTLRLFCHPKLQLVSSEPHTPDQRHDIACFRMQRSGKQPSIIRTQNTCLIKGDLQVEIMLHI